MATVLDKVGVIQLQFFTFGSDRRQYRYAAAVGKEFMNAHAKWERLHHQMAKEHNNFCVLSMTKYAPGSKSGFSYTPLGVLCSFEDVVFANYISRRVWARVETVEPDEKLAVYLGAAADLRTVFAEADALQYFNDTTYLLMQLAKEDLKAASKMAKEFWQ